MEDLIMRVVQLNELGYPHYFLYEDGRLYNTITNEWRIPQKGNEYVLWNIEKTIKPALILNIY